LRRLVVEARDADLLSQARGLLASRVSMLIRNDLERRAAELGLQLIQRRHFLAAGDAPGCPKVKKHGAAPPLRKMALAAAAIPEGKVGQPQRPACHHHARDFPRASGCNPPGRGDGWGALGVTGRLPRNVVIPYTAASPMATPRGCGYDAGEPSLGASFGAVLCWILGSGHRRL